MNLTGFAVSASFLGVVSLVLAGCGSNGSSAGGTGQTTPAPTASVTSVALSCASQTVSVGQSSQCTVTVQGTGSYSSAVNWSASAGTVSATGLYTAPAAVPTPYTVTLTATSVSDAAKSASASIIVAGTIASSSQTITASAGGTITLPDGSSVTIPAGLLTADETVTLTENSVPVNPPANQFLVAAGPALSLSFSAPPSSQGAAHRSMPKFREDLSAGSLLAGISYNFSFGLNSVVSGAEAAFAGISNQADQILYEGLSGAVDTSGNTGAAFLSQLCLNAINSILNPSVSAGLTIDVYFVEAAARPPGSPTEGLLVWNPAAGANGQFVSFTQCPPPSPSGKKTLVVIHGMLSSVEGAYAPILTPAFLANGNYGSVFGIDYEWWNGLEQNGQTVAGFLDQVAACEGGGPIDILAHSEGVAVTLSALTQSTAPKSSIQHLIAVAGPVLGTPLANLVTDQLGTGRYPLLAFFGNLPSQVMVFPPASPGGLQDLLNDQFAMDLATDSSGSGVLAGIRNLWSQDPVLSRLPIIMVGGTSPGAALQICADCFGDFQSEPFDGVVGLDSAFGAGLDLSLYRIPSFFLSHTAMVSDPGVEEDFEFQAGNSHPPQLQISTSSPNASCLAGSHLCSGPAGSVFSFTGSGFAPGSAALIYVQDPTGTEDAPIPLTAQSDGTVAWTDPVPPSKAPGTYGVWLYDIDNGSSNSVIETLCSQSCPPAIPPTAIAVSIAPASVTLAPGATQSFTASVTGTTNASVSWSASGGTITQAGLYTAPAAAGSYSVTATSQVDPNASATAPVTVPFITITPSSISVPEGRSQTFTAAVAGGGGVNWSVEEGAAGGSITIGGIYTAPNAQGTFHVVATSAANSSESAMAPVTVVPASGSVNEWTWMSGSSRADAPGVYGTQGVPAAANTPGSRFTATSSANGNGSLWLFGGDDYLNDLWEFNPGANTWVWESGSKTGDEAGVYGTRGVASPANMPGGRYGSVSWTDKDGNFWLFGGDGYDSAGTGNAYLNDLWEFDAATREWTWVSGSSTVTLTEGEYGALAVYGTQGVPSPDNVPGGRVYAASWIDKSDNLWLFGGVGINSAEAPANLTDLWEFSPATKEWTWVSGGADTINAAGVYGTQGIADPANMPGSRVLASSGIDSAGNLWLFGGSGFDSTGTAGNLNDLWEFNPTTKEWTWVSGSDTVAAASVYGTQGVADPANVPGTRFGSVGWIDNGGNLWLFGGNSGSGDPANDLNDLWEFSPTTKEWTWVSGSSVPAQSGVYGAQGVPAPANLPGARDTPSSWIDGSGNLWLFGGAGYDSAGTQGALNDLWRYQP